MEQVGPKRWKAGGGLLGLEGIGRDCSPWWVFLWGDGNRGGGLTMLWMCKIPLIR